MSELSMSSSIEKLAPAILSAKKEMTNAVKDAKNPFFKSKFADLNSVREACEPALAKYGVSVLQPMVQKDSKTYIRTMLLHETGQYLCSDTEVVCSKQNDAQAYGSAISYARRYGLQSLVSLGAEDNDAEDTMVRTAPVVVKATLPTSTSVTIKPLAPVAKTVKEEQVEKVVTSSFKKTSTPAVEQTKIEGWD